MKKQKPTYTAAAVAIIAAMWCMVGIAAYKWLLWRWV